MRRILPWANHPVSETLPPLLFQGGELWNALLATHDSRLATHFGSITITSLAALSTASLLNGKTAGVPVRQASNWSL
jgi:hypothetical protein